MDDALGVDDDFDFIYGGAEEPVGFDDFEAFVHQGCAIDGDFAAHCPGGVGEDLLLCDLGEVVAGFAPERAARCGEDELIDLVA